MKKNVVICVMLLVMANGLFAGGILTNTNQSVQFTRMLSRNASMGIDAVYFNPAGTALLKDGFHLALHSQTITQVRTITHAAPFLARNEYEGDTFVPVFPNFYAVYKQDNLAFSAGFGPIAGGGTVDFANGLPDFYLMLFQMLPMLQPGLTPEMIAGIVNSTDIAFKGSSIYYGIQFNAAYALNDMISVSLGARYNIARNAYEGSLDNSVLGLFEVDATQSGSAITPVIGINIRPNQKFNIGLKYEHATKLELENETVKDLALAPQFPDGLKTRNDIPAILAGGFSYQLTDALTISAGGNYYFDKNADWEGGEELIDSNTWEFQAGVQYAVSPSLCFSAGYQRTSFGVKDMFQNSMSYHLNADAIGAGARIRLNDGLALDLGGLLTLYDASEIGAVTYERSAWLAAVGIEYSIF